MDRLEGAGEGVSARNQGRLSCAVMLLCLRGIGETISDCSPSDLGGNSTVRPACLFRDGRWELATREVQWTYMTRLRVLKGDTPRLNPGVERGS